EWQRYHRVFDGRGNVTRQGGDSLAALQQIPVIWRGLRQDEVSDLYLVGVTGLDAKPGRYLSQAAPGDSNPYRFEGNRPTSPEPSSVTVTPVVRQAPPHPVGRRSECVRWLGSA